MTQVHELVTLVVALEATAVPHAEPILWADCTLLPSPAANSKCSLATCSLLEGWKPQWNTATQWMNYPREPSLPEARLSGFAFKSFTEGKCTAAMRCQDERQDFMTVRNSVMQPWARSLQLKAENLIDSYYN